ncbi:MAG: LacI family DNA-binding transcriptional regulator [Lacipirellulaceae bacterium]
MASREPKVGVKQIAAETGVSAAAVSLVLNDRPGVSTETRRRVRATAKRLGYQHRSLADRARAAEVAAHRASGLGSIGFYAFGVNAGLGHSYYGAILSGASAAARDAGLQLRFAAFDAPAEFPADLADEGVDGVLVTGRPRPEFVDSLRRRGVPYVLVCCSLAHLEGDSIGPENIESSYRVVRRLAELGHARVAYLGGEPVNTDARERLLGYQWAVEDLGLDRDPGLVSLEFFNTEQGAEGFRRMWRDAAPFTAVYAASDFLAMGVYRVARELGLEVPRDLSVFGFDNNTLCETIHPTLSTVGLDRERVGRLAVKRLHDVIRERQPPLSLRLPTELIERESTAPRATASRA